MAAAHCLAVRGRVRAGTRRRRVRICPRDARSARNVGRIRARCSHTRMRGDRSSVCARSRTRPTRCWCSDMSPTTGRGSGAHQTATRNAPRDARCAVGLPQSSMWIPRRWLETRLRRSLHADAGWASSIAVAWSSRAAAANVSWSRFSCTSLGKVVVSAWGSETQLPSLSHTHAWISTPSRRVRLHRVERAA